MNRLPMPGSLSAQTPDHPADNSAQFPTPHDLKSLTMSGSYLAARHASPAAYATAMRAAADALVADRLLLAEDADRYVAAAGSVSF